MTKLEFVKQLNERLKYLESQIEVVEECYEGVEKLVQEFTLQLADKNEKDDDEDEDENEKGTIIPSYSGAGMFELK